MSSKRAPLPADLMAQKPSVNVNAVAAPPPQEVPVATAPVEPPAATPTAEPAAPVAEAAPAPVVITSTVAQPEQNIQPVAIHAPVHPRSVKQKDSQMSFQVDGARYRRVNLAKAETGITGQQILDEALNMWLAHNGF